MAIGVFDYTYFNPFVFAVEYNADLSVTEGADSGAFNASLYNGVNLAVTEGQDTGGFVASSVTSATLSATEVADTASFVVGTEGKYADLFVTEGEDTGSFASMSTTVASFDVTEGADTGSFYSTSTTYASFNIGEGADTGSVRVFAAFFDVGDADYIYVPYESRSVSLRSDEYRFTVRPEYPTGHVPSENRVAQVDQVRRDRKGNQ